ncbi:hypothetical protein WJX72_008755 [[Myrmecia] bisecta]|uniref:Carboxymethylenebutenolidase n=1 Tax=[Myrmecia] bisecta TaxID=41462 RepID=A0AAW1PKN0_9CHLO
MVPSATVNHVPTLTGGLGTEALRAFYADNFIPRLPEDTKITPVHRVIGHDAVVDEILFEFTHTITMDWLLPGVPPTNRHCKVPFCVVVLFQHDKLQAERIYWDQASVLKQLGLLPPGTPAVSGAEQAAKVADQPSVPSNLMIRQAP